MTSQRLRSVLTVGLAAATFGCATSAPTAAPEPGEARSPQPSQEARARPALRGFDFYAEFLAQEAREEPWASSEEQRLRAAMKRDGWDLRGVTCKGSLCRLELSFATPEALEAFERHDLVEPGEEFGVFHCRGVAEQFDRATLDGVAYLSRHNCTLPNRRTGKAGHCRLCDVLTPEEQEQLRRRSLEE